jgi:pimeloyl-ACP methyl ester carboxylesterase
MIDYPGFGKTTGKRTESILYDQALLMYDLASKEFAGDQIIVYGKSIGTGMASYVAANRNCKLLILETPYYSMPSLAKHYFPIYPVETMIRYSFPVYKYLKEVEAPVIFFHGTKDEIIPYRQSIRLKREHTGITLITIKEGKHNNLAEFELYREKIDSLLSK